MLALFRDVSPSIVHCELSHLAREPIDLKRATAQHLRYVSTLHALGCDIEYLPAEPDLPDAVFVEDTAVVLDELAIITRPGAESRRAETATTAAFLAAHRPLHHIEAPGTLDGGDVLRVGRTLFVGQTPRSNEAGIRQLIAVAGSAGYDVRPLPVTGCLHLKSAVTALTMDLFLLNPAWVDPAWFAPPNAPSRKFFIPVDPAEPFAANALPIGPTIVHAEEFPRTRERIESHGLMVEAIPAGELAKAEGGVTCCSILIV